MHPPPARLQRRHGWLVGVIDYHLDDHAYDPDERYRLIAAILEPTAVSARELAAAYPQRWEIETARDELRSHQRGPGLVLRFQDPRRVYQEAYGDLCVHYAIRQLIHHAALEAHGDPGRDRSPATCGPHAAPPGAIRASPQDTKLAFRPMRYCAKRSGDDATGSK